MGKKRRKLRPGRLLLFFILLAGMIYGVVQVGQKVQSVVSNLHIGQGGTTNDINTGIVVSSRQPEHINEKVTTVSMSSEDLSRGNLVLVNNKVLYPLIDQTESVSLFDYKSNKYNVKDKNVLVSQTVTDSLNRMLDDFYSATGLSTVNVVSGYRTYEFQESLYQDEVKQKGETQASLWVAKPGGSEHHTGLAVDFSLFFKNGTSATYDGSGDYRQLNDNAYQYGFIVRYDQSKSELTGIAYEPWHFRYVGLPHSYIMVEKNMCLEEYIDYLRQYEFGKDHLLVTYENKQYEIYFTTETDVPVPKDKEYEISGNNVDGYIVTVFTETP